MRGYSSFLPSILLLLFSGLLASIKGTSNFLAECEEKPSGLKNFITCCKDGSIIIPDGRRITKDRRVCRRRIRFWMCGSPDTEAKFDSITRGTKIASDLLLLQNWDIYYGNGLIHHSDGTVSIDNLDCWGYRYFVGEDRMAKVKLDNFIPTEFPFCSKITQRHLLCMARDGSYKVISQRPYTDQLGWDIEVSLAAPGENCIKKIYHSSSDKELFNRYADPSRSH